MATAHRTMLSAVLLLASVCSSSALHAARTVASARPATTAVRAAARTVPMLMMSSDSPQPPEDKDYSVDWDTAWASELSRRQSGDASWRPEGREPVSEQQVAQARVQQSADDAVATIQSWSSDWKLWVGLLLFISVVTALASHPSSPQTYSV